MSGGYIYIGATSPNNYSLSPNTISGAPVGIEVTKHAGASIVGNTIQRHATSGIVVDSASQADIAGNAIKRQTAPPLPARENSVVRLSDRPGPLYGPLNRTNTGWAKTIGPAVYCNAGACVTGFMDDKIGFAHFSSDESCIHSTWTNAVFMVGTWRVISIELSRQVCRFSGAFYANGYGQAGTVAFTWNQSKHVLTVRTLDGKIVSGTLLVGAGDFVMWECTGTLVTGEGNIRLLRQS